MGWQRRAAEQPNGGSHFAGESIQSFGLRPLKTAPEDENRRPKAAILHPNKSSLVWLRSSTTGIRQRSAHARNSTNSSGAGSEAGRVENNQFKGRILPFDRRVISRGRHA